MILLLQSRVQLSAQSCSWLSDCWVYQLKRACSFEPGSSYQLMDVSQRSCGGRDNGSKQEGIVFCTERHVRDMICLDGDGMWALLCEIKFKAERPHHRTYLFHFPLSELHTFLFVSQWSSLCVWTCFVPVYKTFTTQWKRLFDSASFWPLYE